MKGNIEKSAEVCVKRLDLSGDPIQMGCQSYCESEKRKTEWRKDNKTINYNDGNHFVTNDNTLIILSNKLEQTGRYTCMSDDVELAKYELNVTSKTFSLFFITL